ncbi:hypothetical protein CEXT_780961 [Caerostris extrusa]|uniref:Uncharacterized protein n=1 Tax=Caerostris extrusa TaxID=172846 RepID=A0AAV4YE86_CAEEX|nr:hypothetical protein CEXT_780961 [Caerostris extrusa]
MFNERDGYLSFLVNSRVCYRPSIRRFKVFVLGKVIGPCVIFYSSPHTMRWRNPTLRPAGLDLSRSFPYPSYAHLCLKKREGEVWTLVKVTGRIGLRQHSFPARSGFS